MESCVNWLYIVLVSSWGKLNVSKQWNSFGSRSKGDCRLLQLCVQLHVHMFTNVICVLWLCDVFKSSNSTGVCAAGGHDINHSDSWVNVISAGLSEGEECIKQAEVRKCFMEARAVFHHSYNKSDKRRNGNNPDWGQMITVVLSGASAATRRSLSLARACVRLIIERGSVSAWETPHQ